MNVWRAVILLITSLIFGMALGIWWANRHQPTNQGTFTDIRGNSSFTRKGPVICIAVSFAAFIVCAYWPSLQKLAETYIQALMNFAAIAFGIGKGAEEVSNGSGGLVGKIMNKITGGGNGNP